MNDTAAQSAAQTLADLALRLGRIIAGALETESETAPSLRQYRMLERLLDHPHRTSELAQTSGIAQPTASAAVASLETRRLVDRQPDPADRRATLIVINRTGRETLAAAKARVHERLAVVTAEMSQEEADALAALQPTLIKGMDRLRDEFKHGPSHRG